MNIIKQKSNQGANKAVRVENMWMTFLLCSLEILLKFRSQSNRETRVENWGLAVAVHQIWQSLIKNLLAMALNVCSCNCSKLYFQKVFDQRNTNFVDFYLTVCEALYNFPFTSQLGTNLIVQNPKEIHWGLRL